MRPIEHYLKREADRLGISVDSLISRLYVAMLEERDPPTPDEYARASRALREAGAT